MILKTIQTLIAVLFFLGLAAQDTISEEPGWFSADSVVAVVNSDPILQSQLDRQIEIEKQRNETVNELKILDTLINEQLLYQAADRESIIISDKKVESHIEELMQFYGTTNMDAFRKRVEEEEKVPFSVYREEVRKKLIMEQLMVYAMDYVPPPESKAREWYEKNKKSMLQVRFQHILIRPKDDTFTADKNANVVIENIRSRIRGGESFGRLARQFSHDRKSASNDGVIGWISFGEVDREIVGYVYNMKEQGKVSPVFKTNKGYHIIKYLGRRYLPYNEIRDRIFQMISQQSRMNQFQEWVKEQRKFSDIRVFIPGYEEHRNSAHVEEQPSPIR